MNSLLLGNGLAGCPRAHSTSSPLRPCASSTLVQSVLQASARLLDNRFIALQRLIRNILRSMTIYIYGTAVGTLNIQPDDRNTRATIAAVQYRSRNRKRATTPGTSFQQDTCVLGAIETGVPAVMPSPSVVKVLIYKCCKSFEHTAVLVSNGYT